MTVDRTAFLSLIREADRTGDMQRSISARKVYADWLEERGECEAAELIRVARELALEVPNPFEHDAGGLELERKRQNELLARYHELIYKVLQTSFRMTDVTLYLGTTTGLRCSWPYWREHGDSVLAAQPVRRVELTERPPVEYCGPGGGWHEHPNVGIFSLDGGEPRSGNQLRLGTADDGTSRVDLRYDQWMDLVTRRLLLVRWPDVDEFVLPHPLNDGLVARWQLTAEEAAAFHERGILTVGEYRALRGLPAFGAASR